MLEVQNLDVYFGVIHALKNVSLMVREGEIVTLIGANGAGKTTILRTISGLKKPADGKILLYGQDITHTPSQGRVRAGISQSPEGRRVFSSMSVLENLELGAYLRKDKEAIAADLRKVYDLFPILSDRKKQAAGTLSGGEQQML
ncbi:MAG TPA: ABC transporter ATP-binding protein, partial [Clostridiales bacterium]|nr:ABC transporter ATP-binding protein [Clostridiales bacterium]